MPGSAFEEEGGIIVADAADQQRFATTSDWGDIGLCPPERQPRTELRSSESTSAHQSSMEFLPQAASRVGPLAFSPTHTSILSPGARHSTRPSRTPMADAL